MGFFVFVTDDVRLTPYDLRLRIRSALCFFVASRPKAAP